MAKPTIEKLPGITKRDRYWFQLGSTLMQVVQPAFENKRFTVVAPDDEARLLGEVFIEIQIAHLGGDAARRLSEHITITTTGKSAIVDANTAAVIRSRRIH